MDEVKEFFEAVAKDCFDLVDQQIDSVKVTVSKEVRGDIATNIDVAVEELIVSEIKKRFPEDDILAEEGYADTAITDGRLWVIDPICGTVNLSRGINAFCANIALVENKDIIAACVVDFAKNDVIWSVGDGVFVNEDRLENIEENEGKVLDVDLGCVFKVSDEEQQEYSRILAGLLQQEGWMLDSFGTSLTAAYVATGKFDANVRYHYGPWDVCSAVFLTRQMGGSAVDFEGNEWTIFSKRLVLSRGLSMKDKIIETIKAA